MSGKRMTDSTRIVLQALVAHPADEHFGLDLSKSTGLAHSTVYGVLERLEGWGWLETDSSTRSEPVRHGAITGSPTKARTFPARRWTKPPDAE
jgi:hypothetical protein